MHFSASIARLLHFSLAGLVTLGLRADVAAAETRPVRPPFTETFEGGTLADCWAVTGTGPFRTQIVTNYVSRYLVMDSSAAGTYARNELTLNVDLSGYTNVTLSFRALGYNDEPHGPPPSPFTGGADFDGVAISTNGVTWYEAVGLRNVTSNNYTQVTLDLNNVLRARSWPYTSNTFIRFNQFDDYPAMTDGLALDDIAIQGQSIGSVFSFAFDAFAPVQYLDVPFPVTLRARHMLGGTLESFSASVTVTGSPPVLVSPSDTGPFAGGVWTGPFVVHELAQGIRLRATGPNGATGQSGVFSVYVTNDLALIATSAPSPALLSNQLAMTLRAFNPGPAVVADVVLSNRLPAQARLLSVSPSQGSCQVDQGLLRCDLGTLPAGSNATVNLTLMPTSFDPITNVAALTATGWDPVPTNNFVESIVPVREAGILEVTPESDFVTSFAIYGPLPGTNMTYTLSNSGNAALRWYVPGVSYLVLIDPYIGWLEPGQSTNVVISLHPDYATLGSYGTGITHLTFTNLSHALGSTSRDLIVTIRTNALPVPFPQAVTTPEDTDVTIRLEGEDFDGHAFTAGIGRVPRRGQLFQTTNGVTRGAQITQANTRVTSSQRQVIFAPATNAFGTAYADFTFWLDDARSPLSGPATATVTVDVAPVPDAPVVVNDHAGTLPNRPTPPIQVLANDFGLDEQPLTVAAFTQPARGTVTRLSGDRFTYMPGPTFTSGTDAFTYTATDSSSSATGTVTLHVGALAGGDWPTPGSSPSHTGYYPTLSGGAAMVPGWSVVLGDKVHPVAVADGKVFVTTLRQRYVSAYSSATGQRLWQSIPALNLPDTMGPPTYFAGRVYVLRNENLESASKLWCLQADTGAAVWSAPIRGQVSAPTVTDRGLWAFGGSDGALYGWTREGLQKFRTNLFSGGQGTVTYARDRLYAFNGSVFSEHDAQNGILNWTWDPDGTVVWGYGCPGIPVADGRAWLATGNALYAFDLAQRSLAWSVTNSFRGTPAVAGGFVYAISTNGIVAYRASDGAYVGLYPLTSVPSEWYYGTAGQPIVTDEEVIVASSSNTYRFDRASFAPLQTLRYGGELSLADGTLYLAGQDGVLRTYFIPPPDDILILATAQPDPAVVWNPITFTFAVTNTGPTSATSVRFDNTMPGSVTVLSAAASQGSCTLAGSRVNCSLGTIPGGQTATVTVQVRPSTTNTVVAAVQTGRMEADANPANNTATFSVPVQWPVLHVSDASVVEGDTGTTNAIFKVTLSAPSDRTVTVVYYTYTYVESHTDVERIPYTVLTFPPGVTERSVAVTIYGDRLNETDERFELQLYSPTNAVIQTDSYGIGTILNDDPLPVLAIEDLSVLEGNQGTNQAVFQVALSAPSARLVSCLVQTLPETAAENEDYLPLWQVLYFNAGTTQQSVALPIRGDVDVEANETLLVTLSEPSAATLGRDSARGTIINDDGLPGQVHRFTLSPVPSPQAANRPFPLTITAVDFFDRVVTNFTGPIALRDPDLGIGEGADLVAKPFSGRPQVRSQLIYLRSELGGPRVLRALGMQVYGLPQGRLPRWTLRLKHTPLDRFDPPAWENHGWTVVHTSDFAFTNAGWCVFPFAAPFLYDGTNNLMVDLSFNSTVATPSAWCYATPSPSTRWLTGSSTNADPLTWTTGIGPVPVAETNVLNLSFPGLAPEWLDPAATGAFTNGVWSGAIRVRQPVPMFILRADDGDNHRGVSEPFAVDLQDDLALSADVSPNPAGLQTPVTNTFAVFNGGPNEAGGVELAEVFPASAQVLDVTSSQGDYQVEAGHVIFRFGTLASAAGATATVVLALVELGWMTNSVTVTRAGTEFYLENNTQELVTEVRPAFYLSISNATVAEPPGANSRYEYFPVTLSGASGSTQTVNVAYATADGTAQHLYPSDYYEDFGRLTFAPGVRTQSIAVLTRGDSLEEVDETFTIRLFNATNAILLTSNAVITIRDDDFPQAFINDVSIAEGNSGATEAVFQVGLSNLSQRTVVLGYATSNLTATSGVDYLGATGTVTFLPGVTNQPIRVPVLGDTETEFDESFLVFLTAVTNVILADATGRGTIVNDDPHRLWIDPLTLFESNRYVPVVIVNLVPASTNFVSVEYSIENGTAIDGRDFTASRRTLLFWPGTTAQTIGIPVLADDIAEPTESFFIRLSHATNASVAAAETEITIVDDDGPPRLWVAGVTLDDAQGDADAMADPGEVLGLKLTVQNTLDHPVTGAVGQLVDFSSPWITPIETTAAYPVIPAGGTAQNLSPFVIRVDPSFPCGAVINLSLLLSGFGATFTAPFSFGTINGPLWLIETIEGVSTVGAGCSLAFDAQRRPHVSYYDATNQALKYALKDAGVWRVQTVASMGVGPEETSLALDALGRPRIAFHSTTVGGFNLASWSGSNWVVETISAGAEGFRPSLALDRFGRPHVSHYHSDLRNWKYTRWDGAAWVSQVPTPEAYMAGLFTSLALTTNDEPRFAFTTESLYRLAYGFWVGTNWVSYSVDSVTSAGRYPSLALTRRDEPRLAYVGSSGSPMYARTLGMTERIVSEQASSRWTSLKLDAAGRPYVAFHRLNGGLRFAVQSNTVWSVQTIDALANAGLTGVSLALDADDAPAIAYAEPKEGLRLARLRTCAPTATPPVRPVLHVERNGAMLELRFRSVAGQSYRVLRANRLTDKPWTPISPTLAGTGEDLAWSDTILPGEPVQFYRLDAF